MQRKRDLGHEVWHEVITEGVSVKTQRSTKESVRCANWMTEVLRYQNAIPKCVAYSKSLEKEIF